MYFPDGDAGSVGVGVCVRTLGISVMMVMMVRLRVLNKIRVNNDPYFMVFWLSCAYTLPDNVGGDGVECGFIKG